MMYDPIGTAIASMAFIFVTLIVVPLMWFAVDLYRRRKK